MQKVPADAQNSLLLGQKVDTNDGTKNVEGQLYPLFTTEGRLSGAIATNSVQPELVNRQLRGSVDVNRNFRLVNHILSVLYAI